MSRIILACSFAAAPLASGTVNANQSDWQQARRACADVAIDPSSAAFGQCVFDLYYSLWNAGRISPNTGRRIDFGNKRLAPIVAWSEQQ